MNYRSAIDDTAALHSKVNILGPFRTRALSSARRAGDGLDSLCVFFVSPSCLRQFLSSSNGTTLLYSATKAIPFVVEQSPVSKEGLVFVTFEIESSGSDPLRNDASNKILALSDGVFSIHFVDDQFGYIAFGSNLAAKSFIPLTKIPFLAADQRLVFITG